MADRANEQTDDQLSRLRCQKIGEWVLQSDANLLSKNGVQVRLEPKAMLVLQYLASKVGTAIAREELEQQCWRNQVVGYDALSNAIIKIRKALGDSATSPRYIETISKFGYRLIAPVTQHNLPTPLSVTTTDSSAEPEPYENTSVGKDIDFKKTIAVLPLRATIHSGVESEYSVQSTADMLAEDILVELSRLKNLTVISRNSSFRFHGTSDLTIVYKELNADFILDGSIVSDAGKLIVRIALNSLEDLSVVWAQRFSVTYSFNSEDKYKSNPDIGAALELEPVKTATVSAICTQLDLMIQPAVSRGTDNQLAYSQFLKGRELDRQDNEASNYEARQQLLAAIEADSLFSSAHSYLSRNHAVCFINRWKGWHNNQLKEALRYADCAIKLDVKNPHAHFARAASILWLREHAAALESADEAIRMDPSFAEAHAVKGMTHLYSGDYFLAVAPLLNAIQIDPYFRDAYQHILAQAYFHLNDFPAAKDLLEQRLLRKPDSDTSRVLLASTLGFMGRLADSQSQWKTALNINPNYSIEHKQSILPYKHSTMFEQITRGLELADINLDTLNK